MNPKKHKILVIVMVSLLILGLVMVYVPLLFLGPK